MSQIIKSVASLFNMPMNNSQLDIYSGKQSF